MTVLATWVEQPEAIAPRQRERTAELGMSQRSIVAKHPTGSGTRAPDFGPSLMRQLRKDAGAQEACHLQVRCSRF